LIARSFTESFKATESQPLVRAGKGAGTFCREGSHKFFRRTPRRHPTPGSESGHVYPELDGSVMPAGVMFKKNKGKPGDVTVTPEDDKIISEVLTPY
jgi:hypothetical protein